MGLLEVVLGIPFVLKKIPPNIYCGFRCKKTLENKETWYLANYRMGLGLIFCGLGTALLSIIYVLYPDLNYKNGFLFFAILAPLAISIKNSFDFLKKI